MSFNAKDWYQASLVQVAAESYLHNVQLAVAADVADRLNTGNNAAQPANPQSVDLDGPTRMTLGTQASPGQADSFVSRYQIIDHHANDATGFSATVILDTQAASPESRYTLAFRSTEYQTKDKGGDFERDALGADTNIQERGFALGQILSMQDYWAKLQQGTSGGNAQASLLAAFKTHLDGNGKINVSGYSLGGHIAQMFTELYEPRVNRTFLFNSPGRGVWNIDRGSLEGLFAAFRAALGNNWPQPAAGNVYEQSWYRAAVATVAASWGLAKLPVSPGFIMLGNAVAKITNLFGHATHNDVEYVANAGWRAPSQYVFIEDQPNVEGWIGRTPWLPSLTGLLKGDYGNSHSLVLMIDSLALSAALGDIDTRYNTDQSLTQRLFAAASNRTGVGPLGANGMAEGDSLERVLDAIRHAVSGPGIEPTPFSIEGGTRRFGSIANRTKYYENIAALVTAARNKGYVIEPVLPQQLAGANVFDATNGEPVPGSLAMQLQVAPALVAGAKSSEGQQLAYRHALLYLSPVVVFGNDLYQNRPDLRLANSNDAQGAADPRGLTDEFLNERARFLERVAYYQVHNLRFQRPLIGMNHDSSIGDRAREGLATAYADNQFFEDKATGIRLPQILNTSTRYFLFGRDVASATATANDVLEGRGNDDKLFGQGGNDTLVGNGGADYLEGGGGRDLLRGGGGNDTYYVIGRDGGDVIEDADRQGKILFEGTDLTGQKAKIAGASGRFTDGTLIYEYKAVQRVKELRIFRSGQEASAIVVRRFNNKDLGIQLDRTREVDLKKGGGANGYRNVEHKRQDGDVVGTPEGSGTRYKADLNALAAPGDVIKLTLGALANFFKVVTGDQTLDFQDGTVTLPLFEGQSQVTFALTQSGDVDTDAAIAFSADWVRPNAEPADTSSADTVTINLDATDELSFTPPTITTTRTILGDRDVIDQDPVQEGTQAALDDLGNVVTDASDPDPARADTLLDSAGNDRIDAGNGSNTITASRGGDDSITAGTGLDVIQAGDGNDIIDGGANDDTISGEGGADRLQGGDGRDRLYGDTITAAGGADVLEGGAGTDLLYGGAGDDWLFGQVSGDFAALVTAGETATAINERGDFLAGGDGNDHVLGTAARDFSAGGLGNDQIAGGGGDDVLLGDSEQSTNAIDNWSVAHTVNGNTHGYVFNNITGAEHPDTGGDDLLVAGAGNDHAFGGGGDDLVRAGTGADIVWGEAGSDTLLGEDGDDVLTGDLAWGGLAEALHGDDFLDGGAGNDRLQGDGGDDALFGGIGDDVVRGDSDGVTGGDDYLDGEDGRDLVIGDGGDDVVLGGAGEDVLYGDQSEGTIADAGDDELYGEAGNDTLAASAGNDLADGGEGNDLIFGGVGEDQISGGEGDDEIYGDDGGASPDGDADVIDGGAGKDLLYAQGGDDQVSGGAGNDSLNGGIGNDLLDAGSDNDTLAGGEGDDALIGGTGDDVLAGNAGSDTYTFSRGDGADKITENGDAGSFDTLTLTDIAQDEATITRKENGDLVIGVAGSADAVTIEGQYSNESNRIEAIVFADGVLLEQADLDAIPNATVQGSDLADNLIGTVGNEAILGGGGNDTLNGKGGNDRLEGGTGVDTYAFSFGMGADTVADVDQGGVVTLGAGLSAEGVNARRSGDDLTLTIRGSAEGFTIEQYFLAANTWVAVDASANATTLDTIVAATTARDADVVQAARDDALSGLESAAVAYYRGQGYEVVSDGVLHHDALANAPGVGSAFQERITRVLGPTGVTISTVLEDFQVPTGVELLEGTVTVQHAQTQSNAATIDAAVFDAAGVATSTVASKQAAVTWTAREHQSIAVHQVFATPTWTLDFNSGLFFPTGSTVSEINYVDRFGDAAGAITAILPAGTPPPTGVRFSGQFEVTLKTEARSVTIEEVVAGAGDNIVSGGALVDGGAGNDTLVGAYFAYGNAGDDQVYADIAYGGAGDDTVSGSILAHGGDGNDIVSDAKTLDGGTGDDQVIGTGVGTTFALDPGHGHDALSATASQHFEYADWYYRNRGIDDWEYLQQYGGWWTFRTEFVGFHLLNLDALAEFAMNQLGWTLAEMLESVFEPYQVPTLYESVPVVAGNDYATIDALVDAGVVTPDTVRFGPGIERGTLALTIERESNGADHLDRHLVIGTGGGNTARIALALPTDEIGTGIERFAFADGTVAKLSELLASASVSVTGSAQNDTLVGAAGTPNTFAGGAGADLLIGGSVNDVFLFNLGDGVDNIVDAAGDDAIVFGPGIAPGDVTLGLGSLLLHVGAQGDAIHIDHFDPNDVFAPPSIDRFRFDDGAGGYTELSYTQLLARGFDIAGTAGNDTLTGTNTVDRITGLAGDDHLDAGHGADTYLIAPGDGVDTVDDTGNDYAAYERDYYTDLGIPNYAFHQLHGGDWHTLTQYSDQYFGTLAELATHFDTLLGFSLQDVQAILGLEQIAELPSTPPVVAGNDYAAIDALIADGIVAVDTVALGAGIDPATVVLTKEIERTAAGDIARTLVIGTGGQHTVRIVLAAPTDAIGTGVERVRFDETATTVGIGSLVAQAATVVLNPEHYYFTAGSGAQVLDDAAVTTVHATGVSRGAVAIGRDGVDLLLSVAGTADVLRIADWYANPQAMPQVTVLFDADAPLDAATMTAEGLIAVGTEVAETLTAVDGFANTLTGLGGNDALNGGTGNDTLTGDAGNDFLAGGGGADRYVFALGDGQDTIVENDATAGVEDTLAFGAGITPNGVTVTRAGDDLTISIDGTTAQVTVDDWFAGSARKIERIAFVDATVWNIATTEGMIAQGNHAPTVASPLADQTANAGTAFSYQVAENAFADTDAGDVLVYTATKADGAALPGWLAFNGATRTFSGTPAPADAASIVVRVTATDVAGASAYDDFVLTALNPGVTLTGTAGNDTLTGGTGDDVISGLAGWDVLAGGVGRDTVDGGTGQDSISGGDGDDTFLPTSGEEYADLYNGGAGYDRILGSAGNDVIRLGSFNGVNTVELIDGGAGTNVIQGNNTPYVGNNLDFSGTTLTNIAEIRGGVYYDTIIGSQGADTIVGGSGIATLAGSGGDDVFIVTVGDIEVDLYSGGTGYDRILGGAANDVIRIGIHTGTNTVELIDGGAGTNVIQGNSAPYVGNNLDFSGTTLTNIAEIRGGVYYDTIVGSQGADTIVGGTSVATLKGEGGDDVFIVTVGDPEADLYNGGAGYDRILGGAANDVIRIGSFNGGNTVELIDGGAGINVIQGNNAPYLANNLDFSNTTLTNIAEIRGGAYYDSVIGSPGADVIVGGTGVDTLKGGGGDDLLAVNGASDVATEDGSAGSDTVLSSVTFTLGAHIEKLLLTGTAAIAGTGNAGDNFIAGNSAANVLYGGAGNDLLRGGAGSAADTLYGETGNDVLEGGAGDDTLTDSSGANLFSGAQGNDSMTGDAGAEIYIGGTGNDTVATGTGADVIAFNRGDGTDTVLASSGQDNVLSVGGGIGYADLKLVKATNDLELWFDGAGADRIAFKDWYAGSPTVQTLQMHVQGMGALYVPGSADPLYASKVTQLNFGGLVTAFDATGTSSWTVTAGALAANLQAGSSVAAIGGDVTFQFGLGVAGGLTGMKVSAIQTVLGTAGLGTAGQTLNPRLAIFGGVETALGESNVLVLEGTNGAETLDDADVNSLLSARDGDDTLIGRSGNDLLAGGSGNDTIYTGGGANVLVHNAGDGVDQVWSGTGANNTLSFGGGIGYNDLSLSKNGNDLVVSAGANDQVVLKDWYAGANNLVNLQVILDATAAFDGNSSDPLLNRRVQQFNFQGLVAQFDAARAANPGLTSWAMTNALLQSHLSGSDTAALGGDLAYYYGKNGGLTGITIQAAQEVIGAAGFGSDAQTLRPFSGISEGFFKLA